MQIENSKLKSFNMIIWMFFLVLVQVWYKADPCFNFSCEFYKTKMSSHFVLFKKVVPLNFRFCSFGNEQNFLSNQKA